MGNPLFDRSAPSELSAAGQVIDFSEEISSMGRLEAAVESDLAALDAAKRPAGWRSALASGRLNFGFSASQPGIPSLEIAIEATVDGVCQRCLAPLRIALQVESRFLLVGVGDRVQDEDGTETWELDEATVRPIDIVDEALVMALPLSARHEDCETGIVDEAIPEDTIRPFADLRSQMEKDK